MSVGVGVCVCVCVCVCGGTGGDGMHLPIVGAICAARELAAFAHISWNGDLSLSHHLAAGPLSCWAVIDGNCQQSLLPRRLGSAWGGLSLHLRHELVSVCSYKSKCVQVSVHSVYTAASRERAENLTSHTGTN